MGIDINLLPAHVQKQIFEKLNAENKTQRELTDKPKNPKIKATPTEIDGHVFPSKHEAERYAELKLRLLAGEISDLRLQVKYTLIPAMKRDDGTTERGVTYTADFVYIEAATGKEIVEDAKGWRSEDYLLKRKMVLFLKGITVHET